MKKFLTATFVIPALLAFGSLAYAQGIADSYHNLTPTGPGTAKGLITEICIYCHTPHAGAPAATDDGTNGRAPLWNRQDSAAVYTLYSSPTLDSTVPQPRSVSKACLSCHDGTVAFNALLNRGGSGRDGLGGGTVTAGSGNSLGNQPQSNALSLLTGDTEQLSNDHPISMVYGTDAKSPGIGTATIGENSHAAGFRPSTASGAFAYVSSTTAAGTAPTFAPEFRLPLYGSNQTVECASCHDPHETRTKQAPDADGNNGGVYFLRVANTNSQLCRTCHLK